MVDGARAWYARDRVMPALPNAVEDDTRQWRGESDLIYRFWTDYLIPDPTRHVIATELLRVMNGWLRALGAREWGDKVFSSRFGEHELTTGYGVAKSRVRSGSPGTAGVLSRPWLGLEPAKQYQAWTGVRFRTDADAAEEADVTSIA
jgi:hypothetical protein